MKYQYLYKSCCLAFLLAAAACGGSSDSGSTDTTTTIEDTVAASTGTVSGIASSLQSAFSATAASGSTAALVKASIQVDELDSCQAGCSEACFYPDSDNEFEYLSDGELAQSSNDDADDTNNDYGLPTGYAECFASCRSVCYSNIGGSSESFDSTEELLEAFYTEACHIFGIDDADCNPAGAASSIGIDENSTLFSAYMDGCSSLCDIGNGGDADLISECTNNCQSEVSNYFDSTLGFDNSTTLAEYFDSVLGSSSNADEDDEESSETDDESDDEESDTESSDDEETTSDSTVVLDNDFSCSTNDDGTVTTCTCPGGGTLTQTLAEAPTVTEEICDEELETTASLTVFDTTVTSVYDACVFVSCGTTITLDGTLTGATAGSSDECSGDSSSVSLIQTSENCSGLTATQDGGTAIDVGLAVTFQLSGSSSSDILGTLCVDGTTTSFSSYDDLVTSIDSTGTCDEANTEAIETACTEECTTSCEDLDDPATCEEACTTVCVEQETEDTSLGGSTEDEVSSEDDDTSEETDEETDTTCEDECVAACDSEEDPTTCAFDCSISCLIDDEDSGVTDEDNDGINTITMCSESCDTVCEAIEEIDDPADPMFGETEDCYSDCSTECISLIGTCTESCTETCSEEVEDDPETIEDESDAGGCHSDCSTN